MVFNNKRMTTELLAKKINNHFSSKDFSEKVKILKKNFANMMYIHSYLTKTGPRQIDIKEKNESGEMVVVGSVKIDNKFFSLMKKTFLKDLSNLSTVFSTSIRKRKTVISPNSFGGVYTPIDLKGGLLDFVNEVKDDLRDLDRVALLSKVKDQLNKFKLSYLINDAGYKEISLDEKEKPELTKLTTDAMAELDNDDDFTAKASAYYDAYEKLKKPKEDVVDLGNLLSKDFFNGLVLKNTITTFLYMYSSLKKLGDGQYIKPDAKMKNSFGGVESYKTLNIEKDKVVKNNNDKKLSTFDNISGVYKGVGILPNFTTEKYDDEAYRTAKTEISNLEKRKSETKEEFLKKKRQSREKLEEERNKYNKILAKFNRNKFLQYFFTVIVSINHEKTATEELTSTQQRNLPTDSVLVAAASKYLSEKNKNERDEYEDEGDEDEGNEDQE